MTKFVCQLGRYEPLNPSTTRELHGHGVNTTLGRNITNVHIQSHWVRIRDNEMVQENLTCSLREAEFEAYPYLDGSLYLPRRRNSSTRLN